MAVVLLVVWIATIGTIALGRLDSTRDRSDLTADGVGTGTPGAGDRSDLNSISARLAKRQDFIEKMADTYLDDRPDHDAAAPDRHDGAERAIGKVGAALPEAGALARMEARQLAFVERLTRYADRRSAAAADSIRRVGLNPTAMLESLDDASAQGGPLFRLSTERDGSLDPRFRRLGVSLARMTALERGLAGIPQVLPASRDFISSGFGYRADPFTGEGAFHAGLDFKGPVGAPIYAAAKGRISFVGQRQGYGNCIEIDHGHGLMTRYAHMSAFRSTVGQEVQSGDVIGAIGSSGRSTGPHLHFEVRIHDRPVNPRPFLEASSHVRQEQRK